MLSKRTNRLIVRMMKPSDFEAWTEFVSALEPKTKIDRKAFATALRKEAKAAKHDRRWEAKIFERDSKRMIGFIDVKTVNRDPYQICDVGYVLIQEFRGKGYASEATRALIPQIFKKLKFHRLEFAIEPTNKPSLRVAKALGLTKEGTRKHYWPTNYPKPSKTWSDQVIYATTPELFKP